MCLGWEILVGKSHSGFDYMLREIQMKIYLIAGTLCKDFGKFR